MRRSFLEDVPWLFSAIGIDETMCEGNCQLLSSATISKMKDYLDDWMLDCCQTVETPAWDTKKTTAAKALAAHISWPFWRASHEKFIFVQELQWKSIELGWTRGANRMGCTHGHMVVPPALFVPNFVICAFIHLVARYRFNMVQQISTNNSAITRMRMRQQLYSLTWSNLKAWGFGYWKTCWSPCKMPSFSWQQGEMHRWVRRLLVET